VSDPERVRDTAPETASETASGNGPETGPTTPPGRWDHLHVPRPRGRRRHLPPSTDPVAWLAALPPGERTRALEQLGEQECEAIELAWAGWAHPGQRPPHDDWRTWVIMAGRGFGKTLAGANWITQAVQDDGTARVALVAATLEEARDVMVEGRSGLLSVAGRFIQDWIPSRRLIRFTSGAEATLFSGASPARLRGPEHSHAWCDELAKWKKPGETWDMLQLGLRACKDPRALVTTTPRPGPVLRRIMAEPATVVTGGTTHANPHLPRAYVARVEQLYAGTRLGRQELDGELLPEGGALWSVETLERARLFDPPPTGKELRYARTVIGVDPPSGDGTCGIVACARGPDGIGHVLADHSVTGRSPEGWASAVADAARIHATREVVAERNQGGRMVTAVLRAADRTLAVRLVNAHEGKSARAQPVALFFEAGRVRLHGRFPDLERELLNLVADAPWHGPGPSPDRADAMVWALTELMLGRQGAPGVRGV
jgi:phage terminase large subunit-like protein